MKKILMTLCFMASFFTGSYAQQQIKIVLSDGTAITKNVWEVESIMFEPVSPIATPATAEKVDLGLSVQWANMNFGATEASGAGYYVGWGDVTGLNYSKNNNYFPTQTPSSHIIGGKYDIVATMWGDEWRLPTDEEVKELVDKCTWTLSGNAYVITGPNRNSITLPFAGKREGTETIDLATSGNYWTGMLSSDSDHAIALVIDNASYQPGNMMRYMGCNIRPVYGKYLTGAGVGTCSVSGITSSAASVKVQFTDDYAKASEFGLCISKSADNLDPENPTITTTTVNNDGSYIFTLSNLDPKTTYYYQAYVKYNGNNNYGTVETFITQAKYPVAEYVDLGLSVKWASWNMGAKSEDDYGSYIAWGDPTGENSSYKNTDYPNDMDNICGSKYDVATQNWGSNWRLPTYSELEELASLSKTIVTRNGVKGLLITGKGDKSGNTLFLPLSGYQNVKGWHNDGKAYYWSGENYTMDQAISCTVGVVSGTLSHDDKGIHISVRPVYAAKSEEEEPAEETAEGKKMTAVDLGLSIKWASCNIGASSSSEAGTYFAWGETTSKSSYDRTNYKFYDVTTQTFANMGTCIKSTEMDAAHVLLGGTWRMPSSTEYDELVNNCTWTWTGNGYRVTGPSGKSIFLPAAGMYSAGELVYNGTQGKYWTCDHDESILHGEDHWATTLDFTNIEYFVAGNYQYKGIPIRPVCK